MRLIKAKVSGYKRLAKDCELNLDTNPVCIVGPNAAGKSSFLDALLHLNHRDPFDRTEKTRVPGGQTLEPRVEARFILNEKERALLDDIPEAAEVRQLSVIKRADATGLRYTTNPYPWRDLSLRNQVKSALKQALESEWVADAQGIESNLDPVPEPAISALFDSALELAGSDDEEIQDQVANFDALGERLKGISSQLQVRADTEADDDAASYAGPAWPPFSQALLELIQTLPELAVLEREDRPLRKVINALSDQVPQFLKFDEEARDLEAEYDLSGERPEDGAAIHDFLALADTSWEQVLEVIESGDKGWKKTFLEDVDQMLRDRAALVWEASDLEVKVDIDGSVLTILLSMQAHDFIDLDLHSDGLQQFMSLRAFVWRTEQEIKPIVLIDEAELHLHYDAQADLVGVFEEQQEAAKIIYTTHSAGCLPRDLGLGVRAIVPETEEIDGRTIQKDHSRAVNRFWTEGKGFSPLLLAMGAGAFAFSATQYAVVTEGMSDALLLPTLIREATGEERLKYQAVPSFAEATADEITRFDLVAGRVAFLADGDEGGRNHVKRLIDNGISDDQILFLGNAEDSDLSIEDLLVKDVYLEAVNAELKAWHGLEYPADQLPGKGRSKAVKDWCAQQKDRHGKPVKLSKVDVAQRVLDQRSAGTKLLAKAATMRKLHEHILAVFDGATGRVEQLRKEAAENLPAPVDEDETA